MEIENMEKIIDELIDEIVRTKGWYSPQVHQGLLDKMVQEAEVRIVNSIFNN